jgi:hypothetical protein
MAKVPITGNFKLFEGAPTTGTNMADSQSVEAAVKGTLASPPASISNFDALVSNANWQLLDEQATATNNTPILRGQQPTSAGHFQGYPRPSIEVEIKYGGKNGTKIINDIFIKGNLRVGGFYQVRMQFINMLNYNDYNSTDPYVLFNAHGPSFNNSTLPAYQLEMEQSEMGYGELHLSDNGNYYIGTPSWGELILKVPPANRTLISLSIYSTLAGYDGNSCPSTKPLMNFSNYYYTANNGGNIFTTGSELYTGNMMDSVAASNAWYIAEGAINYSTNMQEFYFYRVENGVVTNWRMCAYTTDDPGGPGWG